MSEETRESILKEIFVNPEVTARAVDALVPSGNKPRGWSRRSNATYYREVYAHQIQQVLDEMITDEKDRWYLYETWSHMSPQTIYLRVNQSIRYLLDNLDNDKKYRTFLGKVDICRVRGKGVLLTMKVEHRETTAEFRPEVFIAPETEAPPWMKRLNDWILNSKAGDRPFVVEGLMLSPDELRELKLHFLEMKDIMPSITSSTIKLIKIKR